MSDERLGPISDDGLYGHKCHLCGHLDGPTHEAITLLGTPPCSDCSFCDWEAVSAALRAFDPAEGDYFAAMKALDRNEAHPLLDKLCAEVIGD